MAFCTPNLGRVGMSRMRAFYRTGVGLHDIPMSRKAHAAGSVLLGLHHRSLCPWPHFGGAAEDTSSTRPLLVGLIPRRRHYVGEHLEEEQLRQMVKEDEEGASESLGGHPSRTQSSCWSCGEFYGRGSPPISCGKCGAIQPAVTSVNVFELFGIIEHFDLDSSDLEKRYKKLMSQLHPDRFMQKSTEEQLYSSAQSSAVNDGYRTLKSPHARAVYLLKLLGVDFESAKTDFGGSNMEFMMEVMETSSAIEHAGGDQQKLRAIRASFYLPHLSHTCAAASAAFVKRDVRAATDATAKLQYLKRVGDLLNDAIDAQ